MSHNSSEFDVALDTVAIAILIFRDNQILYANPAARALSGHRHMTLLQLPLSALILTDLEPYITGLTQDARFEAQLLTADKRVTWLDFIVAPTTFEGFPAWLGIGIDISQRKQMHSQPTSHADPPVASAAWTIDQADQFAAQVFKAAPSFVYVYDCLDSRTIYASESVGQLLGYTPQEMQAMSGSGIHTLVHPDDLHLVQLHIRLFMNASDGFASDVEYRCKHKNDLWIWLHDRATIFRRTPEGQTMQIIGAVMDVTERMQVEQRLRYQANLLENVSDAIISTDLEFKIVSWNKAAEKIYGWREDEVIGLHVGVLEPEISGKTREQVTQEFQADGYWRGELVHHHRDGSPIYIHSFTTLLRDERGKPIGALGVNRDISERKAAEDEIHRLNAQLEQRVIERTAQLEATNKELEAFSYSISHDLRAPLRSINGFSQALLEDYGQSLDERAQDYIHRVRAASQRMGQLIDDLLNLSRLNRSQMHHEIVDLSAIAHAVANDCMRNEPNRSVEFVITENLSATGDTSLLRVALENLLANAWKFTGRTIRARIEFGCTAAGEYFVRDNGVGFDMTYADKLFGPFQRLHSVTEFPGTGIGLTTVQRIIHRHGGKIRAESAPGQGATFYFTLKDM